MKDPMKRLLAGTKRQMSPWILDNYHWDDSITSAVGTLNLPPLLVYRHRDLCAMDKKI